MLLRVPILLAVSVVFAARVAAQAGLAPAGMKVVPLSVRLEKAPGAVQPAPVTGWSKVLTDPRPLRIHFLRVELGEPGRWRQLDPAPAGPRQARSIHHQTSFRRQPAGDSGDAGGEGALTGDRLSAVVEPRHFALGLAEFDLFFQLLALVGVGLALADADFHLDPAVFPIHAEQR